MIQADWPENYAPLSCGVKVMHIYTAQLEDLTATNPQVNTIELVTSPTDVVQRVRKVQAKRRCHPGSMSEYHNKQPNPDIFAYIFVPNIRTKS